MDNGTSKDEFSGDARTARWALEAAEASGSATNRHHLLAAVFNVLECEDPEAIKLALIDLKHTVDAWVVDVGLPSDFSTPTDAAGVGVEP